MKILSTEGLTKLIQLIKNSFISVNDTVTTDTITLADVATTGDYNDLINTPNIPVYTAGEGIDITNNVISNTQTSAEWGNITGTLSNQTDLSNALNAKQATLVSGTNIKTINNESLLGSGNISISADDIFVAEYGVTTHQALEEAYAAGKQIFATRTFSVIGEDTDIYCLSRVSYDMLGDGNNFIFSSMTNGVVRIIQMSYNPGLEVENFVWSTSSSSIGTVKKVNDISPDSNGNIALTASDVGALPSSTVIPTKISDLTDDTATHPIDKADTLTGLTSTVSELNYVDGVTSAIQTQLDNKLAKKPDGTNNLIDSGNKINTTYIPDIMLGQMLYAGTFVPSTAVATLSTNAKTKLGTTSNTITLTNNTTAITGYKANEGCYYICSADGSFATISLLTGDWLVSTGSAWQKIDNTDAVMGVKGNAESSYRTGNVNITADNVLPTQSSNSGKFLTTNGSTASWGTATTASNTMTFTNKTFDANGTGNSISNLETDDFATGVIQTTVRATSSASDTALASEKAIATALDGKQASGSYVTTNTAQTISAVKTFSAEPLINSNIQFGNVSTGSRGIWGKVGDTDYWRVYGGATASNGGYMELATADDGNEPIYIRQYTGQFSTLKRTATILDASGNTTFPGTVTASSFSGNATSATKATQDASGNTITTTYATKTEMNAVNKNTMRSTEFIVGTQTASTGSWTGVTEDTLLYNGKRITYYLPYGGSGNATLTLTFPDGTNSGAKNIYIAGTTRLTTQYGANSVIPLTYYADKEGWFVDGDRDANNFERLKHSSNIYALEALTSNKLVCGTKDGYKNVDAGVTFDVSYPILWAGSKSNASANFSDVYLAWAGVNLQTTKASWTGTQKSMAFLVGTLNGTMFTIDSSVFTTTVPTTQDNKVYIPLGILYSTYQIYFYSCRDLYAYVNGSFQKISTNFAKGSATQPIYFDSNGQPQKTTYTLSKSVPSDAVFTDTKNTAGSTDTSSKIFLIGATSQGANPQTYSHDTAFVDTDGALNSVTPASGNNSTKVATTAFVTTAIGSYVKKAGDTMTGALNFANGTWNKMGDDAYIGDHNIGGHICIKPSQASHDNDGGITFFNSSDTQLVALKASSGTLTSSGALGLSNNAVKMQYNSTTEAIEFVFT